MMYILYNKIYNMSRDKEGEIKKTARAVVLKRIKSLFKLLFAVFYSVYEFYKLLSKDDKNNNS